MLARWRSSSPRRLLSVALVWSTAVWASATWRRASRMGWSAASSAGLWSELLRMKVSWLSSELGELIGGEPVVLAADVQAHGFAGGGFDAEAVDGGGGFVGLGVGVERR